MTYYSKYLKYKSKYLELKNMIGGRALELDNTIVPKIYSDIKRAKYDVTYPELTKLNIVKYCWVGPPQNMGKYNYGGGFFIYHFSGDNTNVVLPHEFKKMGPFHAIKMITDDSYIGNVTNFTDILPQDFFNAGLKSTIRIYNKPKLEGDQPIIIVGTSYDWSHTYNGWIYDNFGNKMIATYVNVDKILDDLFQNKKEQSQVFNVTRQELKNKKLETYCWISPPQNNQDEFNYGDGFFLYQVNEIVNKIGNDTYNKKYQKVSDSNYKQYGKYAIKKIDGEKVKPAESKIINVENLSYKTTVQLSTTSGKIIPVGTSYDWSPTNDGWIYKTDDGQTYKALYNF